MGLDLTTSDTSIYQTMFQNSRVFRFVILAALHPGTQTAAIFFLMLAMWYGILMGMEVLTS